MCAMGSVKSSMDFEYSINISKLNDSLSKMVVDLKHDSDRDSFVLSAKSVPYSKIKLIVHRLLSRWIPLFDLDAFMGMYPLFILGRESWDRVVPHDKWGGSLLDIGAGQGSVTECARHLFSRIETVETSYGVLLRLKSRGFNATLCDIASSPDAFPKKSFDVISLLNVIDRAQSPISLLRNAINFLKDDGIIVVATPIPVVQRVWTTVSHEPEESFGLAIRESFEDGLLDLVRVFNEMFGLVPVSISRAPYICKSGSPCGIDFYDDAVLVFKKCSKSHKENV